MGMRAYIPKAVQGYLGVRLRAINILVPHPPIPCERELMDRGLGFKV